MVAVVDDIITWGQLGAAVYEHREGIGGVLTWLKNAVLGKRSDIAMLGVPGSGKTVLRLAITGKLPNNGQLPGASPLVEESKRRAAGKRVFFHTLPGQHGQERLSGEKTLFDKQGVDGVIMVVSWGFHAIRGAAAREHLAKQYNGDLEKFREDELKRELTELDHVCAVLRRAHIDMERKPRWLAVAVSKADVFHGRLREAQEYYTPGSGSAFDRRIQLLKDELGTINFHWFAVPVCAWIEPYEWADTTIPSTLGIGHRDRYVENLWRIIESHCARE